MDKEYWKKYYEINPKPSPPSPFANFVLENYLYKNKYLIELGCGNGRDSIFFAESEIDVLALEQCENQVDFLNENFKAKSNIKFLADDFTHPQAKFEYNFDYVYTRFTFHSITEDEEDKTLDWVYSKLNNKSLLLL